MSRISFFPRQVVLARGDHRGQATTLFLVTVTLMLSLIFSAAFLSHQGVQKVASVNSIDSIALSAATWEARGLNLIAALNDGIFQCIRLIRWICAVWAVLAVAAATGYGIPAFAAYSDYAKVAIRNLWDRAKELSVWADRVRETIPSFVLGETVLLSTRLDVKGVLSPSNPSGPHDGENTLELHLRKGEPIGLADALNPILRILGGKIGKPVKSILNPILSGLLGSSREPIRLLVPESDFEKRQHVRFSGFKETESLPIPLLSTSGRRRYAFSTHARPYGGGVAEMTWKSRIFEMDESAP